MKLSAIVLGVVALLALLGWAAYIDSKQAAIHYVVTDSNGQQYENMRLTNSGIGWSSFRDDSGKLLVVRGNYSYKEQ